MPNLGPLELVTFAASFGAATGIIFSKKGRTGFEGFVVGAVLGPVGLAIALMLSPRPPDRPPSTDLL